MASSANAWRLTWSNGCWWRPSDRRFNQADPDALPALDLGYLAAAVVSWDGPWPAPWLLLEVKAVGGGSLRLCDFATAGTAGTPYVTWPPLAV